MTTVRCGENESVESALKRFKRKCQKDGIIGDLKKKTEYVVFKKVTPVIVWGSRSIKMKF